MHFLKNDYINKIDKAGFINYFKRYKNILKQTFLQYDIPIDIYINRV